MTTPAFVPFSAWSRHGKKRRPAASRAACAARRTPVRSSQTELDRFVKCARQQLSPSGMTVTGAEWRSRVLTVFIEREGEGTTADDCADASNVLGELLEDGEFVGDGAYTLEVSTGGAETVLTSDRELEAFRGFPVCVTTREAVKAKTAFWGLLGQCDEEELRITVKGRVVKLKRSVVQEVTLCTAGEVEAEGGK